MMMGCQADPTLPRKVMKNFQFPLGVYPVEEMEPQPGYSVLFEPADGDDDEGEWEEWPDRYVFDVVISSDRIESLCRTLISLFHGRVYPILDVLGHDAYREIDPYISYDLLGSDRFLEGVAQFRDFFFEDGLCGFGAMTEEPFFYFFVDEHKIVTIRTEPELKEKVEKILRAFDLEQTEAGAGSDASAHEHRSVIVAPDGRPDLLSFDEIVEFLRESWRLVLNVDPDTNIDDDGADLGITGWRCLVKAAEENVEAPRYAEVFLAADCLAGAEETACEAVEALAKRTSRELEPEMLVVCADRLLPEEFQEAVGKQWRSKSSPLEPGKVYRSEWL